MDFIAFKLALQRQFNLMKTGELFRTKAGKDEMWTEYLESFPSGSDPIFRERTTHDCNCCKQFIRAVGNMISIIDNKFVSIWDVKLDDEYQIVANSMSRFVKSKAIENFFLHYESTAGTDKNNELKDGVTKTWEHFYFQLPSKFVRNDDKIGSELAELSSTKDVMLRSLTEITTDSINTVVDLIKQGSLLRGDEKLETVLAFQKLKKAFDKLEDKKRAHNIFCWSRVKTTPPNVARMRSDVIGTLLVDLSEDVDLEIAVAKFEDKVNGSKYQRPTALVTEKQKQEAKQDFKDLGLEGAENRRYAVMEDISINNVLFADRSAKKRMTDAFDAVPTKATSKQKSLDTIEEIPIEKFLSDILPNIDSMEVMFENKHTPNLMSLIAPADMTAKTMFKWPNGFSWSYTGDFADSIKERVKAAGGNVTGELCCRLAWYNTDDLDFHMEEGDGHLIHYMTRRHLSRSGGMLDVDANGADGNMANPVENIFYEFINKMIEGRRYRLRVHQYQVRTSSNPGFEVEIDILGTIHSFVYPKAVRQGEKIDVADLVYTKKDGLVVIPILKSSQAVKEVWNIQTQTFHKVQMALLSPNHWDEKAIGNKHYFFMLENCINSGSARGFYNEFLMSELAKHRKTFEIIGSMVKTQESENQLSGLGFSSTQRNELLCRVKGNFTRTIKIKF